MLTIAMRDMHIALCVKDRTLWARDPRTRDLIAELPGETTDNIYAEVSEDFWHDVMPDIAREHGFNPEKIYQDGRSGGWLVMGPLHFPDYLTMVGRTTADDPLPIPEADDSADADTREEYTSAIAERDRFLAFAAEIEQAMKAAGNMFVDRLREAAAPDPELTSARSRAWENASAALRTLFAIVEDEDVEPDGDGGDEATRTALLEALDSFDCALSIDKERGLA